MTVGEINEEWDIFPLRELPVLINGYVCPAGGTSATHWQAVRGPSSGRGILLQRKFQDIRRRLRFGSFLSQIADRIIALWRICTSVRHGV